MKKYPSPSWTAILIILCFSIARSHVATAQTAKLASGATAMWDLHQKDSPSFSWQAHWIWIEENSDVMLARRSFSLEEIPEEAQLRITASYQYRLFVNGKYVCHGPARSAPHHQSYDLLEIRELLQEGDNSIAVRVHFLQGKHSYHHLGRAGLLVQLDSQSGAETSTPHYRSQLEGVFRSVLGR